MSGILLSMTTLGGGFGHPNGSTKAGRETTSRSKLKKQKETKVVCCQHTTESEVRSSDFEREVVSRPTFVLPFGCPGRWSY